MNRIKQVLSLAALVTTATGGMACTQSTMKQAGSLEVVASTRQALTAIDHLTVVVNGAGLPSPVQQNLTPSNGRYGAVVSGLPVASGDSVSAYAYDASGNILYSGHADSVTISDSQTAVVAIVLQDANPTAALAAGAPFINDIFASASSASPGGTIALSVAAWDPDGDALTYAWSANGGSFDDATSLSPIWTAPSGNGTISMSVDVSDPSGTTATMSFTVQVAATGAASISATINNWPSVTSMSADPGRITQGDSTTLSASASDPDGDALTYAWTAGCDGSFDDATLAMPTFTLNTLPDSGECVFGLTVDDGRGGQNAGSLVLQASANPPVVFAPVVVSTFQSASQADGGATVLFNVQATDPQQGQLYFNWTADQGAFSGQSDQSTASQISWTAPSNFSANATITLSMQDVAGGAATTQFTVQPTGVQQISMLPRKHYGAHHVATR